MTCFMYTLRFFCPSKRKRNFYVPGDVETKRLKKSVLPAIAVYLSGSQNKQKSNECQEKMLMSNIDTVKQMYEAFGRGDVPAIIGHLDPNVEWDLDIPTPRSEEH